MDPSVFSSVPEFQIIYPSGQSGPNPFDLIWNPGRLRRRHRRVNSQTQEPVHSESVAQVFSSFPDFHIK